MMVLESLSRHKNVRKVKVSQFQQNSKEKLAELLCQVVLIIVSNEAAWHASITFLQRLNIPLITLISSFSSQV